MNEFRWMKRDIHFFLIKLDFSKFSPTTTTQSRHTLRRTRWARHTVGDERQRATKLLAPMQRARHTACGLRLLDPAVHLV